MSTEDEIVQASIQHNRESQEFERKKNPDADEPFAYPEAYYNHYGTRGYVDAYYGVGDWDATVLEVKSQSAVENATGANEIIRQYNKMREAFFKGTDYRPPTHSLQYELCFTATPDNLRHLWKNEELYRSAVSHTDESTAKQVTSLITMRIPNELTPFVLYRYSSRSDEPSTYEDYYTHEDVTVEDWLRDHIEEMWERLNPVFEDRDI